MQIRSKLPGLRSVADDRNTFGAGASPVAVWTCSTTRAIHSTAWMKPPLVSANGHDSAKSHTIGSAKRAKVLRIFSGSLVQVASVLPRSASRLIDGAKYAISASRHSSG